MLRIRKNYDDRYKHKACTCTQQTEFLLICVQKFIRNYFKIKLLAPDSIKPMAPKYIMSDLLCIKKRSWVLNYSFRRANAGRISFACYCCSNQANGEKINQFDGTQNTGTEKESHYATNWNCESNQITFNVSWRFSSGKIREIINLTNDIQIISDGLTTIALGGQRLEHNFRNTIFIGGRVRWNVAENNNEDIASTICRRIENSVLSVISRVRPAY